jgi:hypothetical protein
VTLEAEVTTDLKRRNFGRVAAVMAAACVIATITVVGDSTALAAKPGSETSINSPSHGPIQGSSFGFFATGPGGKGGWQTSRIAVASFSDSSPADVQQYKTTINWGDGSALTNGQVLCKNNLIRPAPGSAALPGAPSPPIACDTYQVFSSHDYSKAGPHILTVRVSRPTLAVVQFLGSVTAGNYVALGDSFSSGEGAPTNAIPGSQYLPPTDGGGPGGKDICHRSVQAWPELITQDFGYQSAHFTFAACSGSGTEQIDAVGKGSAGANYGEGSQVTRIPSDVGLVTLTAGGDNLGFAPVLQTCILAAIGHRTSDCGPGSATERTIRGELGSLKTELGRVALDIRKSAPHARIVLVGYPYLFPQSPSDCVYDFNGNFLTSLASNLLRRILGPGVPSRLTYLTPSEESWINSIEATANQQLAADAAKSDMEFVSIPDAFSGNELCSDSPNDLNGPKFHTATLTYLATYLKTGHAPQGLLPIEQESFHPTPAGFMAMATEVERYLDTPWSPPTPSRKVIRPVVGACGTSQLISTVASYVSKTTQYSPSEYTITMIKTAGSNPEWASFDLQATAAGATTFQNAVGVAECTSGWQVKDIGDVAVGCSTVPMALWSALGVQCQTGTTAPPASIPQLLACQSTSEVPAVMPTKVELACATDNAYLDNVTWSSWTSQSATGSGDLHLNDCTPDCADGTFQTFPGATVVLSNPATVTYTTASGAGASALLFTSMSGTFPQSANSSFPAGAIPVP